MPDPVAPIYVDEDVDEDVARALAALGHDAISTRQAGNKGQRDSEQLAFSGRERRVLVTCNRRDFEALHEAWRVCAREWNVSVRPLHHGILVVPNEREIDIHTIAVAINDKLRSGGSVADQIWRWRPAVGWQPMVQKRRRTTRAT